MDHINLSGKLFIVQAGGPRGRWSGGGGATCMTCTLAEHSQISSQLNEMSFDSGVGMPAVRVRV